ncbi:2-octaprenyl-3-methyl-6-methoxy-1,4-benzoquinol hydroxylase [Candidatus Erwinia haradaeae]|uniref:2-octaprenyl-3-methyl-6-methoxy-1,4-benzoquinol hydroxylase n=1 Tax=Candidatus Erwinia haradaeae TaxID=1922217 RepID=A0A451DKB5_9GAMM|nr:FAD-dependent oxidoreductase [Candidatus Erwinia haradaeae]VFP87151.1 2-octaprenyl-3-methyl-6-methoxy-1,4-benzoquinol hydroxylase [Candidatus Erwinia haradaeae]
MQHIIEVVIVGGGLTGAALASGLAQYGFDVVVIEQEDVPNFNPLSYPDLRISAISAASVSLLQKLKVWPQVLMMRCVPYRVQEIWEHPMARVILDARSLGLTELGYMVENHVLKYALSKRLHNQNVPLLYNTRLKNLRRINGIWQIFLDNGKVLQARLVVGADGSNSQVRKLANIRIQGWRYAQSCMLISVRCSDHPGDITWQQLTPEGPRAFLPLFGYWASLVWYGKHTYIQKLQSMTMLQLQREIQLNFSDRVGQITPTMSGSFVLSRSHAMNYVLPGLVLVGDAAHTVHPFTGQGVNLGYRDVSALLAILNEAHHQSDQWCSINVLQRYQYQRQKDNRLMQNGIDLLYYIFSNQCLPVKIIRNVGLIAANHAGAIKYDVLAYMLGLAYVTEY